MLFILLSFPTRRSSDLVEEEVEVYVGLCLIEPRVEAAGAGVAVPVDIAQLIARLVGAKVVELEALARDRKSTRLNSSHVANSYAVFCLKKKMKVYSRSY